MRAVRFSYCSCWARVRGDLLQPLFTGVIRSPLFSLIITATPIARSHFSFARPLVYFQGKTNSSGIVVGASLWIKLPGVVATPALIFFIPKWKHRFVFLAIVGVVALVAYLPALIQDAPIVYKNVFGYRAHDLHTIAGVATWGPRVLLFSIIASPASWPQATHAPILFYLENSWKIALALVVILSCLRRRPRSIVDLGATIAMSYVLVYVLNGGFSFQYFAWSLPLWFFLSAWFLIPAAVLTSAYVYALLVFVRQSLAPRRLGLQRLPLLALSNRRAS